jgi:hypothetical protein
VDPPLHHTPSVSLLVSRWFSNVREAKRKMVPAAIPQPRNERGKTGRNGRQSERKEGKRIEKRKRERKKKEGTNDGE